MRIHFVWGYNLVWGYCIANQNQCMTTKPCFGLFFKTFKHGGCNLQRIVTYIWGYFFQNDPNNRSQWLFVSKPRHKKRIFMYSIKAHSVLCTTNLVSTSFGMLFLKIFSTNNIHETYFFGNNIF